MLSKIRTAIRLSGQLWIKDSAGIARCVSSNLMRCIVVLCLLMPKGRLSIISYRLVPDSDSAWVQPTFEGHSAASDVLRELFKTIQVSVGLSSNRAIFLQASAIRRIADACRSA